MGKSSRGQFERMGPGYGVENEPSEEIPMSDYQIISVDSPGLIEEYNLRQVCGAKPLTEESGQELPCRP